MIRTIYVVNFCILDRIWIVFKSDYNLSARFSASSNSFSAFDKSFSASRKFRSASRGRLKTDLLAHPIDRVVHIG